MLQVARRILMGTYALSSGYYEAYYKRAQQARPPPLGACTHWLLATGYWLPAVASAGSGSLPTGCLLPGSRGRL